MCGGAWTVAPHRYSEAFPGVSGENSRTERVAVSCRRRVTCQGYGILTSGCGPVLVTRTQPRAALAQLQGYSGSSTDLPARASSSGRKVSIMTAVSSVVVRPSSMPLMTASTAPGCGPCVKPDGCSVIEPTPTPDPLRAE